jgi:ankyrin repeat protein
MYLLALAPDFAEAADARGDTPLHAAAAAGAAAAAQVLLLAEAALDPLNGNELTPLHLAAEGGRKELVMMLLGAGASAELTDLVSATAA